MNTDDSTDATPYTGPDHGFGDDNAIADEIMNRDWYDDTPSTHDMSRMGARAFALPTTVEALSPEMAAPILKQFVGLTPAQRAQHEPRLVADALRAAARDARILTGVGADATPLAKAQVNLAYREQELERRIADWNGQLGEVTGARAMTDPTTGQTVMQPIYRLSGEGRDVAAKQVVELTRQLAVLKGPEGYRELGDALKASVAQEKERRQQRADLIEVQRRAQHSIREDDLNARAAIHAKHLRGKNNYSASM